MCINFFNDTARTLPLARKQPVKVLENTLKCLHQEFLKNYPFISFSMFSKYRPKNVRPQASIKFNQALCEVCENLDLKIKAVNSVVKPPMASNKDDLLRRCLCQSGSLYFKPDCIHQRCRLCGPVKVWSLVKIEQTLLKVEVREWKMKDVILGGKTVKKKTLVREVMTVKEVMERIKNDLATFPLHNFLACWQYSQFNFKKKNLGVNEVLAVLDFAENFRCSLQDEVQSAHWNYGQVTLHPIVCYYRCPHCDSTVTESLVLISDDLTHDSVAVKAFMKAACQHLKNRITFDKLVQYSDGCSAQYKSKKPFFYIEHSVDIFGVAMERNFFGSRHGKNPSDGESAVVKNAAIRAIKARQILIQNAEDMFNFCKKHLQRDGPCVHFKRNFILVNATTIETLREEEKRIDHQVLKGTRSVHSIKAADGVLAYRKVSCFCGQQPCAYKDYVDSWKKHSVGKRKAKPTAVPQMPEDSPAVSTSTEEQRPHEPNDLSHTPEASNNDTSLQLLSTSADELNDESNDLSHTPEASNNNTSLQLLSTSVAECLDDLNDTVVNFDDLDQEDSATTKTVEPQKEPVEKWSIFPGAWVVAFFHGKVDKTYLGIVLDVEEGEASIKFCRRAGKSFTWPEVEDIGWMSNQSLCPIEPPTLTGREGRERMFVNEQTFLKYFKDV